MEENEEIEQETEPVEEETVYTKHKTKVEDCISDNGLIVDGLGAVMKYLKEQNEAMKKIKDLLYFLEKRQQQWFEIEHPEFKKEFTR